MNPIRTLIDNEYLKYKNSVYTGTQQDPEAAHSLMVKTMQTTSEEHPILSYLALNDFFSPNKISLSNAAGFNKDGNIPTSLLKYLGFNRVVVGTVTHDPWDGNERPRMVRYPETESIVNWMGLPGVGSKRVVENLYKWHDLSVSLTINLMNTPGKSDDELLKDLEGTIKDTLIFPDRYELNISCPNTHSSSGAGLDARGEYQSQLSSMLKVVSESKLSHQKLYVKVSPDLTEDEINDILDVVQDYQVDGITGTNTTTNHFSHFISKSPGKGGASGQAVKYFSRKVQDHFRKEINRRNLDLKYISCGGIDSAYEAQQRLDSGASEIQLFTGLIFKGPKLLREIKRIS